MTQEEYEREQEEIRQLINQINALVAENNRLVEEINYGLRNINVLQNNVVQLHRSVEPKMHSAAGEVQVNSEHTENVRKAIAEMATQYLTFKALSTASKNVTQYTDEYNTKFSYYNHLRRVTLGYVIGLDANFVSSEKMRNIVEKAYLQNTEYWLAYATMAVMLWASNEQEAAKRALDKAMFIAPQKAALYFMLINLRFARNETARNWFINYMERVNPSDLGAEWQYLLQAYLAGAFGEDEKFQEEVGKYFKKMLVQSEATTANFSKRFIDRAYSYADTYLHKTKESFAYLKGTCTEYDKLIDGLSNAEKNAVIAQYYDKLLNEEEETGEDIAQRIENVLYSLVNEYDKAEFEVVKKIKRNEYIISAQGDQTAAQKKFDAEFGKEKNRNFADYLTEWAFTEDSRLTPLSVRRFAITFMKDWIYKGYEKYAEHNRSKVQQAYTFNVDGCEMTATENDFAKCQDTIEKYYEKNKWSNVWGDKMIKIYGLITLVGLLALIIMGVQLAQGHFSPVALTLGILLVLVGVFLLWRQSVAVLEQLKEKKRLSIQRIQHALSELGQWRELFHLEDSKLSDLKDALMRFGDVQE
ncbi:MAG: hypothetical protein IJ439_05625 [Tyzzerella sp.]|nr:hypothetical protein [Tyzzerella sp.]